MNGKKFGGIDLGAVSGIIAEMVNNEFDRSTRDDILSYPADKREAAFVETAKMLTNVYLHSSCAAYFVRLRAIEKVYGEIFAQEIHKVVEGTVYPMLHPQKVQVIEPEDLGIMEQLFAELSGGFPGAFPSEPDIRVSLIELKPISLAIDENRANGNTYYLYDDKYRAYSFHSLEEVAAYVSQVVISREWVEKRGIAKCSTLSGNERRTETLKISMDELKEIFIHTDYRN